MEKVVNLGIPHVGENIFENIDTEELIECALVSETWKVLAENVLLKRWNGKLIEACQMEYVEIVRLLLENLDHESAKDIFGSTVFIHACGFSNREIVKLLLDYSTESNIDLNAKENTTGWTAFMTACLQQQNDIVKLLLDHSIERNIDLNARNTRGWTAFIHACHFGHVT